MKNVLGLLLTGWMLAAPPTSSSPDGVAAPEVCELQGSVYLEPVAAFADHQVLVREVEAFADLVVYKEEAARYADRPGHWYLTEVKAFADFSIHVEEVEALADFTIAYTTFRSAAGCN